MIRDQLREAYRANCNPWEQAHEYGSTTATESGEDVPKTLTVEPVEDQYIPLFIDVEGQPYSLESYTGKDSKAVYRLDSK